VPRLRKLSRGAARGARFSRAQGPPEAKVRDGIGTRRLRPNSSHTRDARLHRRCIARRLQGGRKRLPRADSAASEFSQGPQPRRQELTPAEIVPSTKASPRLSILSIEDGCAKATRRAGSSDAEARVEDPPHRDDNFVTNPKILKQGIADASRTASREAEPDRDDHGDARGRKDGADGALRHVISHRSGETEDTTIADLAVA